MADITGMLQAAAGAGGDVDPYFQNTTLLLHGDGTNGAQNNTFLDSSTNNFTITRNGNTTQGSFSPFSKPDGRWGNYFDGSGDYLTYSPSTSNQFGTGSFTVEAWYYPLTAPTGGDGSFIYDARTASATSSWILGCRLNGTGSGNLLGWYNGSALLEGAALNLNSWNHVVYVRDSGTNTGSLFLNGTRTATQTDSTNYSSTGATATIGSRYTITQYINGYLSSLRLVKGTAVYDPTQTTLTVPTAPLTAITNTSLLTCQSNRFIDNSSNNFTITRNGDVKVTPFSPFPITTAYSPSVNGGSGYFDGSDTLDFPNDTDFAFGTGAFTIDFWIYAPLNSDKFILEGRNAIGIMHITTGGFSSTVGVLRYVGSSTIVSSNVITDNSWHHCAIVRDGSNNITLYVDGVSRGTGTDTTNYTTTAGTFNGIGGRTGVGNFLTGYLSSFRIQKGVAIDFSSVGIPTAPSTSDANTSLLCNFTNAGIYDNTGFNNLETVGNAQIDTTTKKYGTGSMEFDGTGDWLFIPSGPNFQFGTGDFTIEGWFNFVSHADFRVIVDFRTSANQVVPTIYTNASGHLFYFVDGSNRISDTTGLSTGVFIHIAVARSGTSTKMFVNGTQVGSTWTDTANYIAGPLRLGTNFDNTTPFNGFIDDLRITKGVARYTTTFTPPTAAFPNIGE